MTKFSLKDQAQLQSKGIAPDKVNEQIATFKKGIPFVKLLRPATKNDGIIAFSKAEQKKLIARFKGAIPQLNVMKFVPASGAASRMFKALFTFLEEYKPNSESLKSYLERTNNKEIAQFQKQIEAFPFYDAITSKLPTSMETPGHQLYGFIQAMFAEEGHNFGFLPKGLLPFHTYKDATATPFKEHLKEAAMYAASNGQANLHFTVSEEHHELFKEEFDRVGQEISDATNTEFKISYSYQHKTTDTIAVTEANELFRNQDGSLLFRPGGHGALIQNLNTQDADVVFIKNIDNVVVDSYLDEITESKQMLGGVLVQLQEQAFAFAKIIENKTVSEHQVDAIQSFLATQLHVVFPERFEVMKHEEKITFLQQTLHKPIRVCGMVKNEGEPGGGPFWITAPNGDVSLQIVESAQVNMNDEAQVTILKQSTHFNPVDLVCGIRNYKGEKYNLLDFVDHEQGFITDKTKDGKALKALELPGLWNGGMAYWHTIFVEVPLVTFNPVKTVNDLLKPTHQGVKLRYC